MDWIFILLFMLHLVNVSESSSDNQDKMRELENRLSKLEKIVEELEPTFVQRYGLIKRCQVPKVEHGLAQCDVDKNIKPNTKCRVVCNAGYIATPGKDVTRCKKNGDWTIQMQCEVPLVVVGGGEISESSGDSSLEVIDFEERKPCKYGIPDMRSQKSFFNLLYHPAGPEILACNGLTSSGHASCDKWKLSGSNEPWKFHSHPHKGNKIEEMRDHFAEVTKTMSHKSNNPHKKHGRYAAESVTVNGHPVILGGMVNKGDSHEVTDTVRIYDGKDWSTERRSCTMSTKRAFFCAVKLQEGMIVNIGGFGDNANVLNTTYSRSCTSRVYLPPIVKRRFSELPTPLSGHGCTVLPDSYDILVSGGSRNQRDTSQWSSYIYRWEGDSWNRTSNMNMARFGHKLVTVGQNIFAIGGKQRNLNMYLDSIEIFDKEKREWNNSSLTLKKPRAHFGLALVPRSIFPGCE